MVMSPDIEVPIDVPMEFPNGAEVIDDGRNELPKPSKLPSNAIISLILTIRRMRPS